MNKDINKLFSSITSLDAWTQSAILGNWNYTVGASAIRAAMSYIPETPEDNGIEEYTQYEQARKNMLADASNSKLPGLLSLLKDIQQHAANEAAMEVRDLADTMAFMVSRVPTKEAIGREYDDRIRSGCKPRGITRAQFIETEYEANMAAYNKMIALKEDALRLCQTISIDNEHVINDVVPEWLPEAMEQGLINKLHDRWAKLELARTNLRRRKKDRDAAEADQKLIEMVLAKFGEAPYEEEEEVVAEQATTDELPEDAGNLETLKTEEATAPVKPARTRIKASDLAEQA